MNLFLEDTIQQAGALAKEYYERGVDVQETKSETSDLLTEADTAVSTYIVDTIQNTYPSHGIHSEELPDIINPQASYRWIIDPIDGTRNFANNIPHWCVLLALIKDKETILAGVFNPIANDLYTAEKGKGAFLNGAPIYVNKTSALDHAHGHVACAYQGVVYGDYVERYQHVSTQIMTKTSSWTMNMGCALSLCYVAAGGMDYALSNSGMEWDFRAPFLVCEEAGVIVTNSDGDPWKPGRQDYVIANPTLHPILLALFSEEF